jgi:hypothetical protein
MLFSSQANCLCLKTSCNSEGNRVIFKNFLGISKISCELFDGEFSIKISPAPYFERP